MEHSNKRSKYLPPRAEVRLIDQEDELAGHDMWVVESAGGRVRVAVPEIRKILDFDIDEVELVNVGWWPPDRAFTGNSPDGSMTPGNIRLMKEVQR